MLFLQSVFLLSFILSRKTTQNNHIVISGHKTAAQSESCNIQPIVIWKEKIAEKQISRVKKRGIGPYKIQDSLKQEIMGTVLSPVFVGHMNNGRHKKFPAGKGQFPFLSDIYKTVD